ncbi:MAG: hypothetical protein HGGPFJEG_02135 [Ignavibacteria bacterium]|nr:hypothetical protein [Ignavibacteria bacterium]
MSPEFADFLHSRINAIDLKAALINALGWEKVSGNTEKYCMYIFNKTPDELDIDELGAEDLFVIGYLSAMENYHNPNESLEFLKKAKKKLSKSYTVNIIYSLVKSQIAMEKDFCSVWKIYNKVDNNKKLNHDMRLYAEKIILDYMYLYKDFCK